MPRTPDGRPDLQGVWANNGMTPLERPKQWGGRATMTDAELADLKKRVQALQDGGDAFFGDELILAALEGKEKFKSADTQTGNYDQSWLSDRVFDNRTSLIIDPPDGRIPPLVPGAAERARAQAAARQGRGPADSPEDLSLGTRCISFGTPNIRAGYQSYFEITQGPDAIGLRTEMIHDARIFPIGAGPHVSRAIAQYHGDSRARWDGDTFVVETVNYTANATRLGATDKLRIDREVPSRRRRHPRVLRHHRRSDGMVAAVDADDSAQADGRAHVRIRLPRGELRDARHPERRSGPGTGGGRQPLSGSSAGVHSAA